MSDAARQRAAGLACWRGPVEPRPLEGGITNRNFVVRDRGRRFFVRIGDDIPVHGVMRFNELAASRAAAAAGVSPDVVWAERGAIVLEWIDGRTLDAAHVRDDATLARIVALIAGAHRRIPAHLGGPVLAFWVFHVVRDYARTLRAAGSRIVPELDRLLSTAAELERALGPVELVFAHNDLLPANLIDDGERLWLVDWDYAGFNSPLFDLAGLCSNGGLAPAQEERVLEIYFDAPPDDRLRRRFSAMKCASLLREGLWSLVSEHHSELDFDYVAYGDENLRRFESAWSNFVR